MKSPKKVSMFAWSGIGLAVLLGTAIATGDQNDPNTEPEVVGYFSPCYTGDGENALTIALPSDSSGHLEALYIRRKGCEQWSRNLGVVMPGKSIHILNLGDGEMEVFWRKQPHIFGIRPTLIESPPTQDEWSTVTTTNIGGNTVTLSEETHRRIVVS